MAAANRRTPETGEPHETLRDEAEIAEPMASALVLRSADGEPAAPGVPALTVEVDLPPLARAVAPEELAVRIDDVPVAATIVDFDSVGTSSIEIAATATVDLPPLDLRSGPYVRPIGDRSTGPTPRLPNPHARATGPVPTTRRPATTGFDELLSGGPLLRPLGGHVPGATQEVPRLDGPVAGAGARPLQENAWTRFVQAASRRRSDRSA